MAKKPRAKKSTYLHDNADWIMDLFNSGVRATPISKKFNAEKRVKGCPFMETPDIYGFILLEKERRAKANTKPNPMMTNLWNAEGMRAVL